MRKMWKVWEGKQAEGRNAGGGERTEWWVSHAASPLLSLLNLQDAQTHFHQKVPVLQENGEGTDESWKQRALGCRAVLTRAENKHDLC